MDEQTCACSAGPKLIFACSGAADVGAVADQAARKLTREGVGKMFCMAGIGGRVEPILDVARRASRILAIDGCPMDCAAKCLQEAGFEKFDRLQLADFGMKKGETPISDENIDKAAAEAAVLLTGDA